MTKKILEQPTWVQRNPPRRKDRPSSLEYQEVPRLHLPSRLAPRGSLSRPYLEILPANPRQTLQPHEPPCPQLPQRKKQASSPQSPRIQAPGATPASVAVHQLALEQLFPIPPPALGEPAPSPMKKRRFEGLDKDQGANIKEKK